MEYAPDELPSNHNLKCHVCGESQFEEREGFYYCQECGTKQEQVRMVEIERDDFDPDRLRSKKQKIHTAKAEKPQLTSWECYNYILRGFVEELVSFGAKEELKLMTLQVWAAYLRRMEVAFFNRKKPDLPKLGVKYFQNDAKTIYNHSKNARKKRKRNEDPSCTSGAESTNSRNWNRSKRKLDESNYSITSATSGGSGLTSSTSANSNRAIKLGFSSKARAFLKKKMHIKHLEKHQSDAEGLLTCHKQPNAIQLNRTEYKLMLVNIKQVYSILAIALNLIGDEIQLCDLVRFINEGHIGKFNVLQYFPENIANNGNEMLKNINFYKSHEKYTDKALREHIGILCKHTAIHTVKTPDIIKLVQRYTTELCLPKEFAEYIERLINFFPPNFKTRAIGNYPGFEARAMAYIVFTLKLLFGLDDSKEHRISRSSKNLNSKIIQLNCGRQEKQSLLFVWDEWVEYIEMRKIIVSQFNTTFGEQFKQSHTTNQVLEEMAEEMRKTEEKNNLLNDTSANLNLTEKLKHLRTVFERFQQSYKHSENANKSIVRIEFKPSLTPALSYLKNILLLCDRQTDSNSCINIEIPDFMRMDHSQRDINSYLEVKPLIEYFKKDKLKLNVHVIATNRNKEHVGIFRAPLASRYANRFYKADFNVTEDEWGETLHTVCTEPTDDLEFTTVFTKKDGVGRISKKSKRKPIFNPHMNYDLNMIRNDTDDEADNERFPNSTVHRRRNKTPLDNQIKEDLQSLHSFEIFSENNMDPAGSKNFITMPRRNLGNFDLFEGISDEESVLNSDDHDDEMVSHDSGQQNGNNTSLLKKIIKIESNCTDDSLQTSELKKKGKPKEYNTLKMYISNMECWMMLGTILRTTKAQKCQLQDTFPRSFNWLLKTCAQTINVEWPAVFEQLLCIETMFCFGIKDTVTNNNCIYPNKNNSNKDIQAIINSYHDIW